MTPAAARTLKDWNDYVASHSAFVKEWNGIMGL